MVTKSMTTTVMMMTKTVRILLRLGPEPKILHVSVQTILVIWVMPMHQSRSSSRVQ